MTEKRQGLFYTWLCVALKSDFIVRWGWVFRHNSYAEAASFAFKVTEEPVVIGIRSYMRYLFKRQGVF